MLSGSLVGRGLVKLAGFDFYEAIAKALTTIVEKNANEFVATLDFQCIRIQAGRHTLLFVVLIKLELLKERSQSRFEFFVCGGHTKGAEVK